MKAYTVAELDELRRAVETRWLFGSLRQMGPGSHFGRSYFSGEKDKAVEELTRTHMLAGHTAMDLYRADNPELTHPKATENGPSLRVPSGVG